MLQMKLFELFNNEETFEHLKEIFKEDSLIYFSENIIGITYDYGLNDYVDLLKKVKNLNLRQVIISSSKFMNLIDSCVKGNLFINKLKFIDPIPAESIEYVDDYIQKINRSTGIEKEKSKINLFKEIDWIILDECIDIQFVSLQITDKIGIYTNVQLYNNGVLLIDDISILSEVTNLIKEISL
ncbi:hypothetical protein [Bacillus velezensis]|uniref:hypothetical protein n=1 Tax=Bacillus velezensis TaxID=492670 RepID=UPI00203B0A92|nr:hypothetical protein [Bacillus velezensis]MCM3107666.1 hypothetical protein [Bacillus velezensis]MED3448921.1 hypothetical protein [Bacillus velezensis]